jgi:hypothetical protein
LTEKLLTRNKHFSAGALVDESGRVFVNRSEFGCVDGATFVDGFTDDINDSAESFGAYRHENGVSSVSDWLSTDETLSGVERNCAHVVATQVLSDFENKSVFNTIDLESVQNWGERTFELNVDDGTNNLRNLSF